MESGRFVSVVPLNEKNYPTWKIQMKMSLIKDNLFSIVDGKETAPTGAGQETALAKFNQQRGKALAIMVLAIDPKLLYHIGDPTDPVVVWTKLRNVFQKKSWSNKLRLKRKLYNMKLQPGGNLQQHLKEFIELFDELAVVGDAMEDEDRVISLLASLPSSYSTLVTALEAAENVPTWEVVSEKLLHEEHKSSEISHDESKSLMVKQPQSGRRALKCFECQKPGHIRKNCFIYLRKCKQEKFKDSENDQSQRAKISSKTDDSVLLYASAFASSITNSSESWMIDSGATQHMCNNESWFVKIEKLSNPMNVKVGDGRPIKAISEGNVSLNLNLPDGKTKICVLEKVLYVPGLACNLLSVSQTSKHGNKAEFSELDCKILKNNELIAVGNQVGDLYELNCFRKIAANYVEVSSEEKLWHRRFCHLGINNLRKIINKELVTGIDCKVTNELFFCDNCCDGKNHKLPFDKLIGENLSKPLELIHSDVCGPIKPESLGQGNYFVTFIDDSTRYTWIYIIKNKSDVFETFKSWKSIVENQYNAKLKKLRTDNGGEYTSNSFEKYLEMEGIIHQKTIPKTPEQNGVSERMNRTLIESVRSMLSDSGLPKTFWAEAVSTAVYVRNRCPTVALNNKTPYEALNGRKPNVKHLKIFGCISHAHVPKDERSKLDSKSRRCVLVGYGSGVKGYKLYDLIAKRSLHSRDVIFNESQFISSEKECSQNTPLNSIIEIIENENKSEIQSEETDVQTEPELRRSTRTRNAPDRFGEWVYSCTGKINEPSNVNEALTGPESVLWKKAMEDELNSIDTNNVWTLVEPKCDVKPIKTKWVFKRKIGSDGEVCSYKARLVAQGFSQKMGIDYDETFSPVVRFESVRTVIALAAQHDLQIHQMDVSSAFLNGELEEEIYVTQPDGFIVPGKENMVCKLHKSLYGLKQSPRCWNSSLNSFLKNHNFVQSSSDSCIYTSTDNNNLCIVAVYVDDILIASKSIDCINNVKSVFCDQYQMKDLGKLNYFLGVSVVQDNDKIFINQTNFSLSLLKKFGLDNAKPVSTPADVGNLLEKATDECELCDIETYQSAVGSLLYLATKTRPDITFAVCNVARYCSKPTTKHWSAVKRILRYIKGTDQLGIVYNRQDSNNCVGFADADWAGDKNDRKSTSGFCFKLGSGLISWRTNKQTCVALSTAEAEYVALAAASQEGVWLKHLLANLSFGDDSPMIINEDNQAAICLAKNNRDHPKTKHIDIKYHFVRDLIVNEEISVKYCPTSEMLADAFTKSLPAERFIKLRNEMGLSTV